MESPLPMTILVPPHPDGRTAMKRLPCTLQVSLVALLIALAMTATAAGKADAADRTCIDVPRINGWTVVDDRTIEVRVGVNDRYRVSLAGTAVSANLGSAARIGIDPNSGGHLCGQGGAIIAESRRIPVTGVARVEEPGPRTRSGTESGGG
jgi:hypothetical protein